MKRHEGWWRSSLRAGRLTAVAIAYRIVRQKEANRPRTQSLFAFSHAGMADERTLQGKLGVD